MTSCTCYSEDGTCNGAYITTENGKQICKAINREKGGTFHANAICLKTNPNITIKQLKSEPTEGNVYQSCESDEKSDKSYEHMISCN